MQPNKNLHFVITLCLCWFSLIYSFSLFLQLVKTSKYNDCEINNADDPYYNLATYLENQAFDKNNTNPSNVSLINHVSNSLVASPVLSNKSKKSTDYLLFKIDDIISPYLNIHPVRSNESMSIIPQSQNLENYPSSHQMHTPSKGSRIATDSNKIYMKKPGNIKTAPILTTLLAFSKTANAYTFNSDKISTLSSPVFGIFALCSKTVAKSINFTIILLIAIANFHQVITSTTTIANNKYYYFITFKAILNGMIWPILLMNTIYNPDTFYVAIILFENKILVSLIAFISLFNMVYCIYKFQRLKTTKPSKILGADNN